MKAVRFLHGTVAIIMCCALQASEYFRRHNVDQPRIPKQPTQRALEYERAYAADRKERAAGLYNRFKAALGFKPPMQQPRPRVTEYEAAVAMPVMQKFERKNGKDTRGSVDVEESAKPVQNFEIVKKENYLDGNFGIEQLLANAAGKRIGDISYSPTKCWINRLEVDPEQRKKGVGSKLFKSAVDQMKDCEEIRWWATPSSVPFYRKQGAQRDRYEGSYLEMLLDRTGGKAHIKRNFLDRPF
jgi:GNAT superfamily N-acetyltransferase